MPTQLIDHQAQLIALELKRRRPAGSVGSLAGALVDAQVDLNPHQVDAALFAFRSPLSRGALLADEVGLGKTIEAGLVLAQRWAERRRRILVITPANLRKQWYQELTEKFFLPCRILESRSYGMAVRSGHHQPFRCDSIVLCSFQFARAKAEDIRSIDWDLVVIDEAHRLRNVYKPGSVIANVLKLALEGRSKLLLTATPLQNSLLELFGLVSFVDEFAFGSLESFREQFAHHTDQHALARLRSRLQAVCHRTLRRQVLPYIKYTRRLPIVQEFTPEESEDQLYGLVSEYLQRDGLRALPSSQRSLMTLVLRKLLASSTFAIAGALESLADRLERELGLVAAASTPSDALEEDFEAFEETRDEWDEDPASPLSAKDRADFENELADVRAFAELAASIPHNAKGRALLRALAVGFAKARELGAAEKAIVFTESRRTQAYLQRVLQDSAYRDGIVLFNGSNTDEGSRRIYERWLARHRDTDRVTGSKTADMRSALVDYFREEGRIMIATEAAAEGINLQFCSLVVNYDLPWNPQRIEQRIGRCHRYGQQHDVVVVNFLNRNNDADRRVFELLSEKFRLFEGVFGASDEVLGAIESGVDFEKRIAAIYQDCRRAEDIQAAFDRLQEELGGEIDASLRRTRQQLLENFDDEVREKLRVRDEDSRACLDRFERLLMQLTRHELRDCAEFLGDSAFRLHELPDDLVPGAGEPVPLGLYELPRRSGDAHLYRLAHPLAETIVTRAIRRSPPPVLVRFAFEDHKGRVSALEPFEGRSGWMVAAFLSVETMDQGEDHLVLAASVDGGGDLDGGAAQRLLTLPARVLEGVDPAAADPRTRVELDTRRAAIRSEIASRNARHFEAETAKLDAWADDQKVGLERAIKELDRAIQDARRLSASVPTLEEKLACQRCVKELEGERNAKRRSLFDAQDEVDRRRDELIARIETQLTSKHHDRELFTIRWELATR